MNIGSKVIVLFLMSFLCSDLKAQVEPPKTRNGLWFLYSKAKTINGIGLSVNALSDTEPYLNTTVNGLNLQIDPIMFMAASIALVHLIDPEFRNRYSYGEDSMRTDSIRGFLPHLVTNGVNIKFTSAVTEKTNGLNIHLIDISDNSTNGMVISFAGKRNVVNGFAIAAFSNVDKTVRGVQMGLFNKVHRLKGFQLGLWNINQKRSMPLINWAF
jgi:hypothetical protein